ncbi:MAG: GIY-YIG nuclease family protein [Deltaproteobacteria bacterium]|nr:GIY-YIG nuclease family protein [Deltaproteobacteria bacterium]
MDWWVYILRCGDGSLYTGITNDLTRRLETHQQGKGARYTRGRLPVKMVYREACSGRSEASKREVEIKRLPRARKLALLRRRKARRGASRRARSDPSAPLG